MIAVPLASKVTAFLRASLVDRARERPEQTPQALLRRRAVVAVTLIAGSIALGLTLNVEPGEPLFYTASLGVAALWAVGAFASGGLSLGGSARWRWTPRGRAALHGFILGASLLAVFLLGAVAVGQIETLRRPVDELLAHAIYGSLWAVALVTLISGICEELFFRGAVFAAMPRRWEIVGSSIVYALSTIFSGVHLLTFAAICLGLLTAAHRRVTGGVLGPIVIHVTWSLGMLFLLPHALSIGDLL